MLRHRPPALHQPKRGSDLSGQRRGRGGAGHPREPHGAEGVLLPPLRQPVRIKADSNPHGLLNRTVGGFFRQYRIILVRSMRSQNFRQIV